ncbi:MAG: hypothetical protein AB7O59_03070 [Pirellulales bacterium]
MNRFLAAIALAAQLLPWSAAVARAADAPVDATQDRVAADKRALAALQAYVGSWRGVGQVRRGSSRGAWTETSEWAWHFAKGRAELIAELHDAQYFSQLRLAAADEAGQFTLFAKPAVAAGAKSAEAGEVQFAGTLKDGALVMVAENAATDRPARVSIRLVAGGDRMVVLYEKRLGADLYARLGEVGSTRKGSSFATAAASGPECVVTGGLGTIAVEYQGKKYFVCCTGCRDLFNDDPAGVLADYRQRKAAEKAEKARQAEQ